MVSNCENRENIAKSMVREWVRLIIPVLLVTALGTTFLLTISCSSGRSVTLSQNNEGTISKSDPSEGETESSRWSYHEYVLDAEAGYPYKFALTTISGVTTGIWSKDKGGWIVEVSPVVRTRTATYTFKRGGQQKILVEVPAPEVPAKYSWNVTR